MTKGNGATHKGLHRALHKKLPYPPEHKTRDDFLSNAERMFYFTLKSYIGEKAVVCPKVSLKDVFFVGKGVGNDYKKYFNKIAQKHVDFLLCDPQSMKLYCGIELDDSSHSQPNRANRDIFMDRVFQTANLKLFHMPLKAGYTAYNFTEIISCVDGTKIFYEKAQSNPSENVDTVICPKCGIPMVKRKATKGENAGNEFYGCVNYPRCREVKGVV
jgi:hypothetical protein